MMNRTSASCCPRPCASPVLKSSRPANGREALAAAELHSPDLAVLDVMLPDMDGFTVTRRLRAAGKHFPVLFLTAKDDTEDKVTGLTVGGDDYVTKPFSLDEVVARIRAVLRRTQPLQSTTTP